PPAARGVSTRAATAARAGTPIRTTGAAASGRAAATAASTRVACRRTAGRGELITGGVAGRIGAVAAEQSATAEQVQQAAASAVPAIMGRMAVAVAGGRGVVAGIA